MYCTCTCFQGKSVHQYLVDELVITRARSAALSDNKISLEVFLILYSDWHQRPKQKLNCTTHFSFEHYLLIFYFSFNKTLIFINMYVAFTLPFVVFSFAIIVAADAPAIIEERDGFAKGYRYTRTRRQPRGVWETHELRIRSRVVSSSAASTSNSALTVASVRRGDVGAWSRRSFVFFFCRVLG